MNNVDFNALNAVNIRNQKIPAEGPKAIPLTLDFTNANPVTYYVPLMQLEAKGLMSMFQTVFVDLSNTDDQITIQVGTSGQKIVCKPRTQGYYNILCPNPTELFISNTGNGVANTQLFLINVPIAGAVWSTQ